MWRPTGVLLTLIILSSPTATAQFKEMEFSYKTECAGTICQEYILAEGTITADSATGLAKHMLEGGGGHVVIFNSPGGDLDGGMALGRIIRAYGLDTTVNRKVVYWDRMKPDGTEDFVEREAFCASSCTLAFLGGTRRTIENEALFGLHGFRSIFGDAGEAKAQQVVAKLMEYADEMGANREMIQIASATPAETMHWLKRDRAVELRIDNSDRLENEWRLDATSEGTILGALQYPISTEHGDIGAYLIRKNGGIWLTLIRRCGGTSWTRERNKELMQTNAGKTRASVSGSRWMKAKLRGVQDEASSCLTIWIPVTYELLVPNPFLFQVSVSVSFGGHILSAEEYLEQPVSLPRKGIDKVIRALERTK